MDLAFFPGFPPPPRLLARFLPPLAEGAAGHYLERFSAPGDLVLDPFGQSPQVALEALHLGRRVVVANFNPISRLALALAAHPPSVEDLSAALTHLGDQPWRGPGERLEQHVRGLYATVCPECAGPAEADAFDWEAGVLTARVVHCPRCGGPPRTAPATSADQALAGRFQAHGLDYYYLLDRVAARDDPDRQPAEEALGVYPARTQAALAAALVKLEAFDLKSPVRGLLAGLLVSALETVTSLTQERPKALSVPHRYRELNVWRALEQAVHVLAGPAGPGQAVDWPELLAPGAQARLYSHAGPMRTLAGRRPPASAALVLTAAPRPSQAYWTLSALWSAWLWGRESAADLRSVLRRRRYDWDWHAGALRGALSVARAALQPEGRLVGLVAEAEPGLLASLLTAADGAGYALEASAGQPDTAEAQLIWRSAPAPPKPVDWPAHVRAAARRGAHAALTARAEPSRWFSAHLGAWSELAAERLLAGAPDEPVSAVNHLLDPLFRDPLAFQRLNPAGGDDLANGLWHLPPELAPAGIPLADRAEAEVLRQLANGSPLDEQAVVWAVNSTLAGAHTPGRGLVLAGLHSYAEPVEAGAWRLRAEDEPAARQAEVAAIQAELRALGVRHGYTLAGANPLEWREAGQTVYLFAVLNTAVISRYLLAPLTPARKRFLVLPGGRAGLVAHKLRRDPRLPLALASGDWIVLKFRQVRRMAGDGDLTRATLEPALHADPLDEARQLELLPKG